jgi:type IV secretion system protein VirB10
MRTLTASLLLASAAVAQPPESAEAPKLKTRTEIEAPTPTPPREPKDVWIVPAGTKIPIELRQPISTKTAVPGTKVYAQTTFPVVIEGDMVIPAGTWVQGEVDHVKRAGRIKGTAEMQFHLTTLIYPNGYSLDMAAAIDAVPGHESSAMKEPGTVKHDSEKGKDLERVGTGASQGGTIGALGGVAVRPSMGGLRAGSITGMAVGTAIALLARGSDVRFESGTAVEIALNRPMAVERVKTQAAK